MLDLLSNREKSCNYLKSIIIIFALVLATGARPALATNGYFMIGYGAKSNGVGGAGVALAQDRLVGAINPAAMALAADGFDGGLRVLGAIRNASIDCRGIGACDTVVKDRSARDLFLIPNFGYKRTFGDALALGVTVYGNGGINTTYGRAFYDEALARVQGGRPGDPGFPRDGKLGIDFSQLFIAPSLAWRLLDGHTVGLSPILAVQRFSARGLETFARYSSDPTSLSGRGTDYMIGGGFRVGWTGLVLPRLTLGAQFTSRIWTQDSVKYNGFIAQDGDLDAPPHWTIGFAFDATPRVTVVFDFQRILYERIDAVSDPGSDRHGALHGHHTRAPPGRGRRDWLRLARSERVQARRRVACVRRAHPPRGLESRLEPDPGSRGAAEHRRAGDDQRQRDDRGQLALRDGRGAVVCVPVRVQEDHARPPVRAPRCARQAFDR